MRLAAVIVLVWSTVALPVRAEILGADLRVDGLVCPFCAFGIEKKLHAVKGVTTVDVLLDDGIVELGFAESNAATIADLRAAVEAAGFTLAGLHLRVRGTLTVGDSAAILEVGQSFRFVLLEGSDGRPQPIGDETREEIRTASAGGIIVIEGSVHDHRDALPGLTVEKLEAAP